MNFDDAMREFRAYLVDEASTDVAPRPDRNRLEELSPRSRRLRATILAGCALVVTAVIVGAITLRSTRPAPDAVAAARVDWGLDAVVRVRQDTGVPIQTAINRAVSDITRRADRAGIAGFDLKAYDDGVIRMRFPGGEARYQVEDFLRVGRYAVLTPPDPADDPEPGYALRLRAVTEYGARPRQTGGPYSPTEQTAQMMSGPPGQRRKLAPVVRALHADTELGPMDLIVEQRALGAVAAVNGDGAIVQGTFECALGLGAPLISTCGGGVGGPFTAPDGTTHAAVFTTFAPVAPKIARIELRSTDGRTFPGTVGNGWYLIVASTRGPMRVLHEGTLIGYDAKGNRIATAALSSSP